MKKMILLAPLTFFACGPIPVHQAEKQCLQRALLAKQPRGEVAVGVNSDGKTAGRFDVTVSSDFIFGRDPAAVFDI